MKAAQPSPAPLGTTATESAVGAAGGRVLTTAMLFGAARSLVIEHAGERYVLSVTRNGKLILTK